MSDDETVSTDETKEITLGFRSPASRAGALSFTGRLIAECCVHMRDETAFSVYETGSVYQTCGIYVLEYLRHLGGTPQSDRHTVWLAATLESLMKTMDAYFRDDHVPEVITDALAEAGESWEGGK